MKGVLDRIGFLIENPIDFECPPEIVSFRSSSVEGWGLFPSQIGFIVDRSSYGGLSGDWWSGHEGSLCLWGGCYLRWKLGCYRRR